MDAVFQSTLHNLAFENEFLLTGLLGLSSLHMQRSLPDPSKARKQTNVYRVKSLSLYRDALAKLDVQSDTYEAALMMSLVLIILTSQDHKENGQLTVINWLVMYRGLSAVMNLRSHIDILATKVAPVFYRELSILHTPPVIPTILLSMIATIDTNDSDFVGLESYCMTLDTMAKLFASLREDGLSTPFFVRVVTWPSWLKDEFVGFAREKRPRALVILAYYLSFLKLMNDVWWIEGIADSEISAINQMVGPEWQIYLNIPIQVVDTNNNQEITDLLLS